MSVSTTKKSRVLGLLAAGLLSATALTTASLLAPSLPVYAETQPVVATSTQGYADLVEKVMPAVISVEVKFANVANNEQGEMGRPGLAAAGSAGQMSAQDQHRSRDGEAADLS